MTSRQLENLHDKLCAKLYRLNIAKTIETDASIKFKLENQIAETETEIEKVEAQLDGKTKQHLKNPYRGLSAFREQDEPFFFGRDGYIEQIHQTVLRQSFTAVLGASGSGKSSIVYAGLMPRLRRTPMSAGGPWAIATFRPGQEADRHDPFIALAEGLIPLLHPEFENDRITRRERINDLALGFKNVKFSLLQIVSDILENTAEERLLLFADQFEETFTLCREPDRKPFLDLLLQAIHLADNSGRFRFILTMRADFLNKAITYRPLADVLNSPQAGKNPPLEGAQGEVKSPIIILGPMNTDELRDCITRPAHRAEIEIESGLTDRILNDLAHSPGHLPLLEFALTRLWEEKEEKADGCLSHATYDAIGGVEKALADKANTFFDSLKTEKAQEHVRQIFIQLVQPGAGTEDTRRLARREDIGADKWDMVVKLANARLVVTSGSPDGAETVEIVHEALLRHWDKLIDWMEADRTFRAWQERLRISLKQWQELDQDPSALLRGAVLAEGEAWLTQRPADLSETEKAYLQAGIEARDREQKARQERQEQMLQLEQARAKEAEARAKDQAESLSKQKRMQKFILAVAVIAVVVAIVAGFQFLQNRDLYAETKRLNRQAESNAAEAETARNEAETVRAEAQQTLERNSLFVKDLQTQMRDLNHPPVDSVMNVAVEQLLTDVLADAQQLYDQKRYDEIAPLLTNATQLSADPSFMSVVLHNLGVFPDLVDISAGTFMMGSPPDEVDRDTDETQHPVTVSGFQMSRYEVTQGQYEFVMGDNPSRFKDENRPVENVSWHEATAFCDKLSELTGLTFRLPTEAEWEYACRAVPFNEGAQGDVYTPFNLGENITTDQVNYDGTYPYNNGPTGEYRGETVPVGSLNAPNALGLHDMHGNVWEWCSDWYGGNYYDECRRQGTVHDPVGPADGSYRVLRGGSWGGFGLSCRSAYRLNDSPGRRLLLVGFRLVFVP